MILSPLLILPLIFNITIITNSIIVFEFSLLGSSNTQLRFVVRFILHNFCLTFNSEMKKANYIIIKNNLEC